MSLGIGIPARVTTLIEKRRLLLTVTWILISASSFLFERIQDDEVTYFVEAKGILTAGATIPSHFVIVPLIFSAFASDLYNSILAARLVTTIVVLATSLLIYETTRDDSSFIASMLYLTSFYTIRFGLRFYLDPYGGFFAVAAIYFMYKQKGRFVGASAILAAFSRELAAPLAIVFAALSYYKRLGLGSYLIGALVVAIPGLALIYFVTGIQSAVVGSASVVASISLFDASFLSSAVVSWLQYTLLSPLIVVGLVFAKEKASRLEFYPMVSSILILSLTPGFIGNGAATEYPYIFNTIACVVAGTGLAALASRLNIQTTSLAKVLVGLLLLEVAGQSYVATALSPNHTVGIQDYGFWYDQELLSYLDQNYNGGKIYAANLDGLLDSRLATNWVWTPQTILPALKDNPHWLVTFSSYVKMGLVPESVTVKTVGPFLIVHQVNASLSSFITATNVSRWTL